MRPVAYVCLKDAAARARTIAALERTGHAAIPQPTGFHLIGAIDRVIEGNQSWLQPALIVIDAWSPGVAGTTIAAGLRDLGITIPIVLIAGPGEQSPISADASLHIVDAANAENVVAHLASNSSRLRRDDELIALDL